MASVKNFAISLVVTLCLLLVLEGGARIVTSVQETFAADKGPKEERDWFVWSPVVGWERKPGFKGWSAGADREFDAAGFQSVDSHQVAAQGRPKVLFIGDSTTFGFGVPSDATFSEVVDQLLPDVDTINLGLSGYTSYQGLMVFRQYAASLHPDLVVVSFNYNDRRYVPPGEQDGPEEFGRAFAASRQPGHDVAAHLEAFHLFRGARFVARKLHLMEPKPPGNVRLDAVYPRVDEEHYRANLEAIAQEGSKLGIPVIFLVLEDNPLQSWHLHRGVEHLDQGEYPQAIAYLKVGMDAVSAFSDLSRFYLAKAYGAAGDGKRADRTMYVSMVRSLHGASPIRLDTVYNDIMRDVAARNGVDVVDATAWQTAHPEHFIDSCHLDVAGHRAVGEMLAPRISHLLAVSTH